MHSRDRNKGKFSGSRIWKEKKLPLLLFQGWSLIFQLNASKSPLHASSWDFQGGGEDVVYGSLETVFCFARVRAFGYSHGEITWIDPMTLNTIYVLSTLKFISPPWMWPLNSRLIYQTTYQIAPLRSPHFKCNKLKTKLVFWLIIFSSKLILFFHYS